MTNEISDACDLYGHGGNIYRLAWEMGMQERQIIDFSVSVNPLGVSKKVKAEMRKHLKYLHNYPDPEAGRLRKRLAQYHGIDTETILCGNGSTGLIYLITRVLSPQNILIPAPTFSEYERAIALLQNITPPPHPLPSYVLTDLPQGEGDSLRIPSPSRGEGEGGGKLSSIETINRLSISYFMLNKETGFEINPEEFIEAMKGTDMAFLCNPNNPTGRLLKKEDVGKIAEAARDLQCILVVDEAFIDFCPDETVIKDVKKNPYLIVLRSLTNFYALSGLRIGYGVFPRHLMGGLEECGEPWTVNSLAQRAAVVAIKDKVFRGETLRLIKGEKRFLEKSFSKLGIKFFSSDTNFYLLKVSGANEICRLFERRGILVRDCTNFRGLDDTYLRVAVKSHRENTILMRELTTILQNLS